MRKCLPAGFLSPIPLRGRAQSAPAMPVTVLSRGLPHTSYLSGEQDPWPVTGEIGALAKRVDTAAPSAA